MWGHETLCTRNEPPGGLMLYSSAIPRSHFAGRFSMTLNSSVGVPRSLCRSCVYSNRTDFHILGAQFDELIQHCECPQFDGYLAWRSRSRTDLHTPSDRLTSSAYSASRLHSRASMDSGHPSSRFSRSGYLLIREALPSSRLFLPVN